MHSCETVPAPPPATGPNLLHQLGRLIIRSRSSSPSSRGSGDARDRLLHAKLLAAKPSTSHQVQSQPKPDLDEPKPQLEAQLSNHIHALWSEQIPICIEVLLAPDCQDCFAALNREEKDSSFDKLHSQQRALLLERWTMRAIVNRPHDSPTFMTSQWLLNAVRSQLHFSQLAAWLARLKNTKEDPTERRRKLSRETCNFKKVEANCDEKDLPDDQRKLNIVYSIKIPGESYKTAEFSRTPTDHTFPVTDIGNNLYLKVMLESLPRTDEIPKVKCTCQPKRRASKEFPANVYDELAGKLNDLSLGPKCSKYQDVLINSNVGNSNRRLSIVSNEDSTEYLYTTKEDKTLVDDRMHTPCSENGKHKCNCDDESDNNNHRSSTSISQEPKKIDERRLKEIAKYKRRLRKEKLKKLCESTSSEGEKDKPKEFHTSIPILQAARFDRFRAIGCYRNQTYLTLPASRIESRSPFIDAISVPVSQFKRTNTVSTQTDDFLCPCGTPLQIKCERCSMNGMVRSEANYNLASINDNALEDQQEVGIRRKRVDDVQALKKHKCDNPSSSSKCDINYSFNFSDSEAGTKAESMKKEDESIIKRPKLRRFFPIVDKIERIVTDRFYQKDQPEKDIEELHLKNDDSVFSRPNNGVFSTPLTSELSMFSQAKKATISKDDDAAFSLSKNDAALLKMEKDDTVFSRPKETKRQKTFSISNDDYVMYEKCDYGSFDKCEAESPREENGFPFPDSSKHSLDNQIPSPTEMDRFRWRFDSAASMVFHSKTGLPLTSSPAPLRRGNNCFDFDDSINGIPGIKSALFHPISPVSPSVPPSPIPPALTAPPPAPLEVAPTQHPVAKKEKTPKLRIGPSAGLLGSFEESALKGRLEPVATVHGFTAELGASGAFCPPHKRLPVTVFFYAPGETNAPYMGHINLGSGGYRVPNSGTIQVSLFNPHGTLVKMFVVLYDLTSMPPNARTFLRQRTLYMPAGADPPSPQKIHKWLRYLIHLRFMTSKSGKLYLHTDIRIIVSRKADLDTATAHSAIFKPIPTNQNKPQDKSPNQKGGDSKASNITSNGTLTRQPNRVFGGCSEFDSEIYKGDMREIGYDNQNGVSYELRSFTYAPENPKYSPR